MTLTQFIILEMTEIISILGYAVYLEIIELRFLGLDKDLKRNIIKRGIKETPKNPIYISYNDNKEYFEGSLIEEDAKNKTNDSNDEF